MSQSVASPLTMICLPLPNPANIDPTNAKGAFCMKKNPTPIPISKPPPIAHVLLSFFYVSYYSPYFPNKLLFFLTEGAVHMG